MDGQDSGSATYDLLEGWKHQLQMSYVQLAIEVASFEQSSRLTSERERYRQLDRIARDIERAEYALKLFRLQHMNLAAPLLAKLRGEAA